MKNRKVQALVEHNAVFWQTKDRTVAIENTPSKNVVSNLEEIVSAHTILAGTPNVREDMKENASEIPKNNTPENINNNTPENINDLPIDHIDAVDRKTITDDNNSISNTIPDNIPDNSQRRDFVVSDNISNNNTSSNDNDELSNMTSTDIDIMVTEVRKNKCKEYISYISTEHSKAPSILSTIELEVSNEINNPDNSIDAEEWKQGTSLIVLDSMIAGPREAKLSRNRKAKVRFFLEQK